MTLLTACTSRKVYSDYVEGIDFNQFKTFAWLPSTEGDSSEDLYNNEIVISNIQKQVNDEMKARGLEVNTENPDLLILLHLNFQQREELVRTPIYSSYNYYYPGFYAGPGYPYYYYYYNTVPSISGYDIRPVEFTQGTIVVDVVRAETKELIWRGWSETRIDDPEKFKKQIQKTVQGIYKEYPVRRPKK